MEYKNYDCGSFKLHVIKTDKFKTVHMEINFRSKVREKEIPYKTMLSDILTDCSLKYPNKRDVVIRIEELYKTIIYGTTNKTGETINTIFVSDFIAPEFIKDKNYYEEVLDFPIEMILHPNVINKEFAIKPFNVIKERMKMEIESINDNPVKKSVHNALKVATKDTATSYSVLGTLEDLELVTPTTLYKAYEKMIKDDLCDVFVIGNVDPDETERIIKKHFKLRTIKMQNLNLYVDNDFRGKTQIKSDESAFVQTSLNLVYNIGELTSYERNVVFHVFNYIFGNGGLSSKLYKNVREKNSLCYGISSMFLKYDQLLLIQVSLEDENKDKAIKLIKSSLNEMIKGDFSVEELEDAKMNLINSIDMSLDNNVAILNNYVFHLFDNLPLFDDRKMMIKKVTKEEVIAVAKKLKLNTIYYLSGGQNGKN